VWVEKYLSGNREVLFIRFNCSSDYRVEGKWQVKWNLSWPRRLRKLVKFVKFALSKKYKQKEKLGLHTIGYNIEDGKPAILKHRAYNPKKLPLVTYSKV